MDDFLLPLNNEENVGGAGLLKALLSGTLSIVFSVTCSVSCRSPDTTSGCGVDDCASGDTNINGLGVGALRIFGGL